MPSSAVRTFSEADEYAAAIRATRAELTVTGRGDFVAKLIRIDLHHLWMQRFSENVPRILSAASPFRWLGGGRYRPPTRTGIHPEPIPGVGNTHQVLLGHQKQQAQCRQHHRRENDAERGPG
jgi:hypothetical protein